MIVGAETYTSLVTNLPHIGSEVTWDIILETLQAIILIPIARWWLKCHDRKEHTIDEDYLRRQ